MPTYCDGNAAFQTSHDEYDSNRRRDLLKVMRSGSSTPMKETPESFMETPESWLALSMFKNTVKRRHYESEKVLTDIKAAGARNLEL